MRPDHKLKRVELAKWCLKQYGRKVDVNTVWGRLVNTDFSAMIKKNGSPNTQKKTGFGNLVLLKLETHLISTRKSLMKVL